MNLLIKYEMGLFIASYKVNEMCKMTLGYILFPYGIKKRLRKLVLSCLVLSCIKVIEFKVMFNSIKVLRK